ncbi:hypothetical protein BVC80_8801g35 [Macleaya cordata]|uniref:Leucine-rich repeat n=1 Tax=Macleaya cordata TaxID=56857 RepID=A0A200QEA6_MACCD|nr:hypothetical protein BVC80_8801g35 [Macleaya cordata]
MNAQLWRSVRLKIFLKFVVYLFDGQTSSMVIPKALENAKKLRTVFSMRGILDEHIQQIIVSNINHIRVLDLSGARFKELPPSVRKLKHLRYLDLSYTKIEVLPEWITCLYNLQTLILRECSSLRALLKDIGSLKHLSLQTLNVEGCLNLKDLLPKEMKNLINLRHIKCNVSFSMILREYMPNGIGHLNNLQTLSEFALGKNTTEASVGELERLNLLKGTLNIRNLHNVTDAMDAPRANLKEKQDLRNLLLYWSCDRDADELERFGTDFYGEACPKSFPSLVELTLSSMKNLEEWVAPPVSSKFASCFPFLEKISIAHCPKLISIPTMFPSLLELEVWNINFTTISSVVNILLGCQGLKSSLDGLRCLNSLQEIKIGWFSEELNIFPTVSINKGEEEEEEGTNIQHYYFISLKSLTIDGGTKNKCLPEYLQYLTTLQYLKIENVDELVALPEWLRNLSSLRKLEVYNCKNLMHLPSKNGIRGLSSIDSLKLEGISEIPDCFPAEGLQHLISLRKLEIQGWSKLESLPHQLQQLTNLVTLIFDSFDGLVALPEWLGDLSSLEYLYIYQ